MITLTQNLIKIIFVDFINFLNSKKNCINSNTNILTLTQKLEFYLILKKIVDFIAFLTKY